MRKNWTIGIPNALYSHTYLPFWKSYWQGLGLTVLVSSPTDQTIINDSIKLAVTDCCLPMKLLHGHVAALAGKTDYLFLPRLVGRPGATYCPKVLAAPDVIKATVPSLQPVIAPRLIGDYGPKDRRALYKCALRFTTNLYAISRAYQWAKDSIEPAISNTKDDSCAIALLGYSYITQDAAINGNIKSKLAALGARAVSTNDILAAASRPALMPVKEPFWKDSTRMLAAGLAAMEGQYPNIGGVVRLTSFSCGPDAVTDRLLETASQHYQMPYLSISIDEHTADAGIATRIEAFCDLISRRQLIKGN